MTTPIPEKDERGSGHEIQTNPSDSSITPADAPPLQADRIVPPSNPIDLLQRAETTYTALFEATDRHNILASRWNIVDTWTRLAVTLSASLSALSLFTKDSPMTIAFALTTAIVSALNTAWDPAQRSTQHRRASMIFRHQLVALSALAQAVRSGFNQGSYVTETITGPRTGDTYDTARYVPNMTRQEFTEYSTELIRHEQEFLETVDSAPPINRLVNYNSEQTPRSSWGLKRMKRYYERQQEAARIRNMYAQSFRDSLIGRP